MSISRRQFLIGTSSGLILPKAVELFVGYLDKWEKPLLIKPPEIKTKLYAIDWTGEGSYQLQLDVLEDEVPSFIGVTVEEFADLYMGGFDPDMYYWGVYELEADDEINDDFAADYWMEHHSASEKAFEYLYEIDLDLDSDTDSSNGWIEFTDGPCPGNDSRFVQVDQLGLSLLQEKLNLKNYNTQVIIG